MPKKRKKAAKKSAKKKPTKKKVKAKKKKIAKKKSKAKGKKAAKKKEKKTLLGYVTHYFPHVNAAVVKLKKPLAVGDMIEIVGHTSRFTQRVDSMQIDHAPVQKAGKGAEIGLQVKERVREHDEVLALK